MTLLVLTMFTVFDEAINVVSPDIWVGPKTHFVGNWGRGDFVYYE